MAYKLNKTDGTLLTELVDGQIDTTSSDLTLIGRNYVGFGEAFNENLIKLLENFASSGAPSTPIKGQMRLISSERKRAQAGRPARQRSPAKCRSRSSCPSDSDDAPPASNITNQQKNCATCTP